MANVNSPVGFRDTGRTAGNSYTGGLALGKMAYNASAVYWGDALILTSGKLAIATVTGNTGAAVAGIAVYFSWQSIAQNKFVRQPWYPGSDSAGNADVNVHYISDDNAQFAVQALLGPFTQADIGLYANFATGTPNTSVGSSGMSLDDGSKNATKGSLPFQIIDLVKAPALGSDVTTAYNLVIVKIANLSAAGSAP